MTSGQYSFCLRLNADWSIQISEGLAVCQAPVHKEKKAKRKVMETIVTELAEGFRGVSPVKIRVVRIKGRGYKRYSQLYV